MDDDHSSLGDRLRTVRTGLGLEQTHVAQALGVDPAVVNRHEHDKRGVSEEAALRYAKYYGVPVEFLLQGPKTLATNHDAVIAGIPKTRGERLTFIRRQRGFVKLAPTARMIGVNPITMNHHERGLREITRQAAELYAGFFGVTAGYILFGEGLPEENFASIVGQIASGGRVNDMPVIGSGEEVRRVAVPPMPWMADNHQLEVYEVVGDDLYPVYFNGDVIVVQCNDGPVSALDINGRECIVTTASGEKLLRLVKYEGEDHYTIFSPHAPPQFGVRLRAALPVRSIHRGMLAPAQLT